RLLGRIERQIRVLDVAGNQPRTLERAADPFRDPLHQPLELFRVRCRHGYEPQVPLAFPAIDAIQHEEVKMHIKIERTAESLDQRHGSGHTARTCQAGLADQMPRDRAIDDAEHLRHDLGPGREQIAQRKWQRQHPLADRLSRQDFVHEQRGRLGHPPSAAARTEAAALAAERNQLLSLTRLALDAQKPVLESATLQIRLKLVLDRIGAFGDQPWLALIAIYVLTNLFTEVLTNNAAAVLVFPIAAATAATLGVSFEPFVFVIMMAASAGFATPIGYQTNLMVYGPGGYRFSDYVKFGVPLNLLVGAVTVVLAPIFWPF